jgi:hypothetical protein
MRSLAILALLSLAGCHNSPTGPGNKYLVTASASPQSLKAGGVTTITVKITNLTDSSQTFDANFCGPAYRVFSPAGTQLNAPGACFTVYIIKTLAPGETAVYSSDWTTIAVDSVGHPTGPLPAGSYTVRGATPDDVDASKVSNSAITVQLTP